ncbi:MAG: LysE family translocator, partial [Mesorhizobium sp.]
MLAELHQFIIVFTAYVIAAGSPGPSNMRIMAVAMN